MIIDNNVVVFETFIVAVGTWMADEKVCGS